MSALILPAENRELSPYTGWTRDHWAAVADHLLLSLRQYFSASRARVLPPGRTSSSGVDSDGLEGFARSFLLFGFRLAGERGNDPHGFLDWYRDGLIAGTDPANPERWPIPGELPQAKVEAASIALILQLTRPWLWDTLDRQQQQHVIDWFATVVGTSYPVNNWLWFRVTVETFLASVGGPHDPADIVADFDLFESFYKEHGWYADGVQRAYDYYCGWAMQLYPLLWTGSQGAESFGARALEPVWRDRLADFLDDYVHLVGGDGMPVIEGRSLIYRFASAAPLWMGAYSGATRLSPGVIRRASSGILRAFVERGGISDDGLLTIGFYGEWPGMAQSYSGSGSPYWASKGMLGLALPADHEVWQATEEPLPVERSDVRRIIPAAGWVLSGTKDDGIVRLYNHGSDHAMLGDRTSDSPLYARFGYSNVTIPPLTGGTIDSPSDNSVGAIDDSGRSTHRSGFATLLTGDDGAAAYAASAADTHWVDTSADTGPDHGSGRTGDVVDGPGISTASLVRGPWEVRVAHVASGAQHRIRVSGWPLAGASEARQTASASGMTITAGDLESQVVALVGDARPSVHVEGGTSPIGEVTSVPWLEFDAVGAGETLVVAVRLGAADAAARPTVAAPVGRVADAVPVARVAGGADGVSVVVTWPDGPVSALTLPR